MSDSDRWLEDLRSAKSAIKSAEQAIRDVRAWLYQNGTRRFPLELDQSFESLNKSLQNVATFVDAIDETNTSLIIKVMSGQLSLSEVLCLRHTMTSDRRQYAQASKEDAESQRSCGELK